MVHRKSLSLSAMDSALELKRKYEAGEIRTADEALVYLKDSELFKLLLQDIEPTVQHLLTRLSQLAEIPYSNQFAQVQKWMQQLVDESFCGEGFSLTGKRDDLLSCYNSMITDVLIRMESPATEQIEEGISWILKYQHVQRNQLNAWTGSRIHKYGGCLKSVPCYIGVVKAMVALSSYTNSNLCSGNPKLGEKLHAGLEYILDHQLYLRTSDGSPITPYITKLAYPFTYKTNLIEILRLLKAHNRDMDPRCQRAKSFLMLKLRNSGYWQVNSFAVPKYWVHFDKTRQPGFWISHELQKLLGN